MDQSLAQRALEEPRVKRLMTITGVNATVAMSVLAAIGDIVGSARRKSRESTSDSILGSGNPATNRPITAASRNKVEPMRDQCSSKRPGLFLAHPARCVHSSSGSENKRGKHVAAVATARKLAVVVWHMLTKDEDFTWSRPALLQWKLRKLELKAGHPSRRGGHQKGSAAAYSNKSARDSEREATGNAEEEYRRFVANWKQQSPKGRSDAQMRCDDHRLRDRAGTSTLLFATGSPERQ